MSRFADLRIINLSSCQELASDRQLEETVRHDGLVRIVGMACPIDVFREPNGLRLEDFHEVWERSSAQPDGLRLPDEIDLMLTKDDAGRALDLADQTFLQQKIRANYGAQLLTASLPLAQKILARFADHAICGKALQNRDAEVQALALQTLCELAAQGDWFSRDLLDRQP